MDWSKIGSLSIVGLKGMSLLFVVVFNV